MEWSPREMDRLYELYKQHFNQLRLAVIAVNRDLGSTQPEKTWMQLVGREKFESLLTNPADPKVSERWVRRFSRGHEGEFPNLRVA